MFPKEVAAAHGVAALGPRCGLAGQAHLWVGRHSKATPHGCLQILGDCQSARVVRRRVDEQTRLERQPLARQFARHIQSNVGNGLVARAAEDQLFSQQLEADRLEVLRGEGADR